MNNKTDLVKFVDFQKFYYVFNEEYLKVAREFLPEMKKESKYCNLTAFPIYNPEKKECFFYYCFNIKDYFKHKIISHNNYKVTMYENPAHYFNVLVGLVLSTCTFHRLAIDSKQYEMPSGYCDFCLESYQNLKKFVSFGNFDDSFKTDYFSLID